MIASDVRVFFFFFFLFFFFTRKIFTRTNFPGRETSRDFPSFFNFLVKDKYSKKKKKKNMEIERSLLVLS